MLIFKMGDLRKIAIDTRNKSLTAALELKTTPGVLKYDTIHITNLKTKKILAGMK